MCFLTPSIPGETVCHHIVQPGISGAREKRFSGTGMSVGVGEFLTGETKGIFSRAHPYKDDFFDRNCVV